MVPMTLLDDLEGGCIIFVAGALGGSVFYFAKGTMRSSSKGCCLAGGVQAVVTNAPRIRRCAAWAGVVGAIVHRTGHWEAPNSLALARASANAVFSMHKGASSVFREGVGGAMCGAATGLAISMLLESSR